MNSGIQLNTHLENKSVSGNSSLAFMQINEITLLNLHIISCCTYWVSAIATAKLYIHNDKPWSEFICICISKKLNRERAKGWIYCISPVFPSANITRSIPLSNLEFVLHLLNFLTFWLHILNNKTKWNEYIIATS